MFMLCYPLKLLLLHTYVRNPNSIHGTWLRVAANCEGAVTAEGLAMELNTWVGVPAQPIMRRLTAHLLRVGMYGQARAGVPGRGFEGHVVDTESLPRDFWR